MVNHWIKAWAIATLLLLSGCITRPSVNTASYREITAQQFVSVVGYGIDDSRHGQNYAYIYIGSDSAYDYIYSRLIGKFGNQEFHYYKIKKEALSLPRRLNFPTTGADVRDYYKARPLEAVPEPTKEEAEVAGVPLISNVYTTEQLTTRFRELLKAAPR